MKEFGLSQKLIGGFSAMVLLIAVTGYIGYHSGGRMFEDLQGVTDSTLPALDLLLQTDRDLHQALVAERSFIYVNPESESFKALLASHQENLEQANDRWNQFKEIVTLPPGMQSVLTDYERLIGIWYATTNRIRAARVQNTPAGRREAIDLTNGPSEKQFDAARECLNQLTEVMEKQATERRADAYAGHRTATVASIVVTGLGLAAGIVLAWVLGVRLSRTLRGVAESLAQNAAQTSSAAGQISISSQQLAEGANTQAASLEETSASLEEVASMGKRNAEHATKARELARKMRSSSDHGSGEMDRMSEAMNEIAAASSNIGNIIKTIDEIAFQTNILALNAAVEAARAGEAGAGFAIVADEVRSLARRSAEAARETQTKIEDSLEKSRNGVELSTRVADALKEITGQAREVDVIVEEIANGSSEQAQGIDQINGAVSQMDQITQGNAASAEESASAAEEMNAQTVCLKQAGEQLLRLVGVKGGALASADDPPKSAA